MAYKACMFDLDGTLADTTESLVISVNATLKELGFSEISAVQCRQFVGSGARLLIERSLREVGADAAMLLSEAMEIYGRIFDEKCTYHVVPYRGIPELLLDLKCKGVKLAVLSNKPHRQTVQVVETVFGKNLFNLIQGQMEGIPRKPDPQAAIAIAEKLGARASEMIYIGDSEVDMTTGQAAQMKTIGVSWGFRTRPTLEKAGAVYIADSPEELMELIKE